MSAWAAGTPARWPGCSTSPQQGDIERHLVRRRVLKVDYDPTRPGERGMFFGAAGIYDGIHLCTGTIHTRGLTGSWASTATLLTILGRALFRGAESVGSAGPRSRSPPTASPAARARAPWSWPPRWIDWCWARARSGTMAGRHPFHRGRPSGRCGLLRHSRQLLFGGKNRELPDPPYRSHSAGRIELRLDVPFTIDGEFFRRRRAARGDHRGRGSALRQAAAVSGRIARASRAIVAPELATPVAAAVAAVAGSGPAAHGPASAPYCSTAAACATVTGTG